MAQRSWLIQFVDDGVLDCLYPGYIGGQVLVYFGVDKHPRESYQYFTNQIEGFKQFRDKYHMSRLGQLGLGEFIVQLSDQFYDPPVSEKRGAK